RRLGSCRNQTFANLLSSGPTHSAYRISRAPQGPFPPALGELGRAEEHSAAPSLLVVDAGDVADGEPVLGLVAHANLVAGADLALLDDAEVGARLARGREVDGERCVLHARAELPARNARLGDLEDGAADLPELADHGARDVHSRHRQVLAEVAVLELAAELPLPPGGVFARVRIDRLVGPAVHLPVGLVVAGDVDSPHRHAPLDGRLPDGGRFPPAQPFDLPRRADVDGEQPAAHGKGDRSLTKPGWDSTRAIQAAIAGLR